MIRDDAKSCFCIKGEHVAGLLEYSPIEVRCSDTWVELIIKSPGAHRHP